MTKDDLKWPQVCFHNEIWEAYVMSFNFSRNLTTFSNISSTLYHMSHMTPKRLLLIVIDPEISVFWKAYVKSFNLSYNLTTFGDVRNLTQSNPKWPRLTFSAFFTCEDFEWPHNWLLLRNFCQGFLFEVNWISFGLDRSLTPFDPKWPPLTFVEFFFPSGSRMVSKSTFIENLPSGP